MELWPPIRQPRYLLRKLFRSPVFTLVAIVTLALGIGANAAIFSVVHGVLLKPLRFDEPERLVGVWHTAPGLGYELVNQSPATYFTYRDENRAFEDIGMWDPSQVSVTGLEEPEWLDAMYVTDGTLPLLGVKPFLGRLFTAEDDSPESAETVLLSHGYWQRRFGGDPEVLGETLRIDGRVHTIIGVLGPELRFLRFEPQLFLPFRFDRSKVFVGNFSFQAVARLRPGVDLASANADIERMIPLAVEMFPGGLTLEMLREAKFGPRARALKADVVGDVGSVLWVLLGTVGLVLLIACANVANLFLVRAEGRQQELAIRTAMGADRGRLAREFLSESVTLGLLGGLVGLLFAYSGLRLLPAIAPDELPRLHEIGIDATVLGFTFLLSVVAGLFLGLVPVLKYRSPSLTGALKEGGRGASEGRERHRARSALVVFQVALALVLLIGSGLMIRSFPALRNVHPGFVEPGEVLTLRIFVPGAEVEDQEQTARTHEQIARRIEQIPGVVSVGLSSSITMDGWDSNDATEVEEFPVPEGQLPPIRRYKWVAGRYFETMGNPVLAGRTITWADVYNRAPVAVVTENLAREYWDDPREAVGKRIRWGAPPQPSEPLENPWREIVGVVGNVHDNGVGEEATTVVYWPMLMTDFWGEETLVRRSMAYAIRTKRLRNPGFPEQIRGAVWSVNDNLPLANVRTLEEILDASMARTAFTLVMLGIASSVALVLGLVGIYGVVSYTVSRRTREIGVRMALGARRSDVSRLVIGDGVPLVGIGLLVGLGVALGLTRAMAALLFGVAPVDPVTYAIVSLVLAAVALLASYVPARRAARLDPTEALRWE